jgi:hypothetical protein
VQKWPQPIVAAARGKFTGNGVTPRLNVQKIWCQNVGDKEQEPHTLLKGDRGRRSKYRCNLKVGVPISSNISEERLLVRHFQNSRVYFAQ